MCGQSKELGGSPKEERAKGLSSLKDHALGMAVKCSISIENKRAKD